MNYIGCFNRSRAANCLQPVFFRSWCASMLPGVECYPCPLCAVPGAPRCCQVWTYCRRAPLRRSWRLDAARCGVLPPCHLRLPGVPRCCQAWSVVRCTILRRPGASMLPGVECCPLHRCAVPGAPQWCPLCYVIHIIVYHRF